MSTSMSRISIPRWHLPFLAALLSASAPAAEPVTYRDFDAPPHLYRQRTPADRFTRMKDDLEAATIIQHICGG